MLTPEQKQKLYNWYNATSTEDEDTQDLESYENWLERQLLSRIEKEELQDTSDIDDEKTLLQQIIEELNTSDLNVCHTGDLEEETKTTANALLRVVEREKLKDKLTFYKKLDKKIEKVLNSELELTEWSGEVYQKIIKLEDQL